MRCKTLLVFAVVGALLLAWLSFFPGGNQEQPVQADAPAKPSAVTTAALSPTVAENFSSLNAASPWLDPGVLAALIGLGGIVVGALIAGGFGMYQMRRTAQLTREQLRMQHQQAQEILRLQKELDEQIQEQERERQQRETTSEHARAAMLHANTLAERVQAYRAAVHSDPRLARLQILDMSRPLEVTNIYVRVRLHQDTATTYGSDAALRLTEAQHDPNTLLRMDQFDLERRASEALDPDEAIRIYRRCVIVGDPGAGKTTLLKYLTLQSIDSHLPGLPDQPIHIELSDFVSSGHLDLLEFAATRWEERYGFPKAEARAYMEERLEAGKAWLLLDALDETVIGETAEAAEQSYKRVNEAILQEATRYHLSPIVVTARKAGYHQRTRLSGFTEVEVLDFRREDIQQFIHAWFACHPAPPKHATPSDLIARLARNPRIQALAANPLLLALIVIVYEEQLDLPDRRAELYNRCTETLLTKWDASRDVRRLREFKPERKRQLLEVIAWHFHTQRQRYFPQRELLKVIAGFLPRVGLPAEMNTRTLAEIAAENGLLKEQAREWYGFLHLTLQEYFAAHYATDHNQLEVLLSHRGDPWWEEVLLLYAGQVADASPLLRQLLGQESSRSVREDLFCTNLILAGRCLAARPTLWQTSLREEVISRLFQKLMSTPYSLTREHAASTLVEIGGMEVNARLLHLLADDKLDVDLHWSIVRALDKLGERSVAPDLVPLLARYWFEPNMSQSIAEVLSELGERTVAPALLQLLDEYKYSPLTDVHQNVTYVLGRLGERSVASDLVRFLADDKLDRSVRTSIVVALGRLGERAVVPDLLQLLANDRFEADVRQSAAKALGTLGEQSIVPDLLRLLVDEKLDRFVRTSIAETLGRLGERAVVPDLLGFLADEKLDKSVRSSVTWALGTLGEQSIVPDLLRLLVDERLDRDVRRSIAWALVRLGERAVVPDLLRLLADEKLDIYVRQSTALALLERLGERAVVPDLLRLRADGRLDKYAREDIVWALGKRGERSVASDLLRLLREGRLFSNTTGESIAGVLGTLGERAVVPDLLRFLTDDRLDKDLRLSSVWSLSGLGDRSVVPDMMRLLADAGLDKELRGDIAKALGMLGDRTVVPDLLRLLADGKLDRSIRWSVIQTIGDLANDEATVSALATYLNMTESANDVYRALWTLSRRAGIRLFGGDGPGGEQIEVTRW